MSNILARVVSFYCVNKVNKKSIYERISIFNERNGTGQSYYWIDQYVMLEFLIQDWRIEVFQSGPKKSR